MIRTLAVVFLAIFLAACSTTKPTVVKKRTFETVRIEADLLDPDKCPWPKREDHLILGTDLEGADYLLAGYEAWRCSEMTRATIKQQADRQASDVAKR